MPCVTFSTRSRGPRLRIPDLRAANCFLDEFFPPLPIKCSPAPSPTTNKSPPPKGFLSLKPLAAWQLDLDARLKFLTDWLETSKPPIFWISGFFFPQAFLTGAVQNHARKFNFEIDRLEFFYLFQDGKLKPEDVKEKPENGVYVHGFFLEGARFSSSEKSIRPSRPKILYTSFPVMHFDPVLDRKAPDGMYKCPIYKVLSRRGVLLTTGHSTNFVIFLEVPSDQPEDVWVRAGVAGFLALRT